MAKAKAKVSKLSANKVPASAVPSATTGMLGDALPSTMTTGSKSFQGAQIPSPKRLVGADVIDGSQNVPSANVPSLADIKTMQDMQEEANPVRPFARKAKVKPGKIMYVKDGKAQGK